MQMSDRVEDVLDSERFRWVVTGGGGFIGSNLVEKLLRLGQTVICLDNFETGFKKNIQSAIEIARRHLEKEGKEFKENSFILFEENIEDLEACRLACDQADFVLHQAALGSVPRSIKEPLRTNRANVEGFLNVLIAAKEEEKVRRVVYASSSSVYGDNVDEVKVEHRVGSPLSPYAVTKQINESYARVFSQIYGLETIGLRYFNVFGKRQNPEGAYAAVIPLWIRAMLEDQQTHINGDGKTTRDFCYIENVVSMNILAALSQNHETEAEVYNVGNNKTTSLSQLHNMISEIVSRKSIKHHVMPAQFREFREGDVRHSNASIDKALNIGYKPDVKIKEALEETVEWYLQEGFNEIR